MKEVFELIDSQRSKFLELDKANGMLMDFEQECFFAKQQIMKNDYALKIAKNNKGSLQGAILNVAAIGVSLNPAEKHAYLVPREGMICLDISYQGLKKIATDSGSIKWAKAELVYEKDSFSYQGPCTVPDHTANVFENRGDIIGAYCIAKLPDDTYMVETMPIAEMNKIRDVSKAYQKNSGPWKDWPEEMYKKTITKRAYKSWPQSAQKQRLDTAIHVLHESEGTAYSLEQKAEFDKLYKKANALEMYLFMSSLDQDTYGALFKSFETEKTKNKAKLKELIDEGREYLHGELFTDFAEKIESADVSGVLEILDDVGEHGEAKLIAQLTPEQQTRFENVKKEAA